MKKVLLAVAVVAFFASCKKDYTCTCADTTGVEPILADVVYKYEGLKKSEAETAETGCKALSDNIFTCTWAED
jgi:hypothetical protein